MTDERKDKSFYEFKIDSQTECTHDITLFKIKNGKNESFDYLLVVKDNHNL